MGYESYPTLPPIPNAVPTIPYATPEIAPPMNPQNTGFRLYTAGSSLVSNGNPGARATVVLRLPADARLFADNRLLNLTGSERKFLTPELPTGQDFAYKFRVEYDRNGETLSATRKVAVRAGGIVTVEFTDMTVKTTPEKNTGGGGNAVAAIPTSNSVQNTNASIAPTIPSGETNATTAANVPGISAPSPTPAVERAMIRVKLPPGATLYVDEHRSPSNDLVRQFSTPPLPVGKEFAYLMKAEVVRNGQVETFTQKVPFKAGERVDVDFTVPGR
jgi:uncharacterized protein (TIGR03000 family)